MLGPGGVGGLVGGLLARAGHPVVFLAGGQTAAALAAGGLSVASDRYGSFTVPVAARTELAEPVDAVLVAVKATALEPALARVPPESLGSALVVPLLNGIEHVASLRRRYPPEQVVPASISVESARVAPGRIEHSSPFARMELASATAPRERVERLADRLRDAGLDVTVRDDETAVLWHKLAFLAPLALLTTHAGAPVGTVRSERGDDLVAVVGEVAAVAAAAGAPIDPAGLLDTVRRLPAGMKSSMQRDAEAGRGTELDAIGGAVLRAARRYGVSVPVTTRVVADLAGRDSTTTTG